MQVFNKIAGFSLGEADIIRRAMSKKKKKILLDPETNYHGRFVDGLMKKGASESEAEEFWEQLLEFAKYAFNKSHAAAYAHVAYYTAWLKYHYPAEYMCSVMTRTEFKKLPILINDCRKAGLRIDPPDINRSMNDFTNTTEGIVFGFGNIKGLGASGHAIVEERMKNGAFTSVKDFVTRMLMNHPQSYDKSVVESLIKTGAFDTFCGGNRTSILNSIDDFADTTKKMLQKEADVKVRKDTLEALQREKVPSEAAIRKATRSLKTTESSLAKLRELYVQHTFPLVAEDRKSKLDAEYELLGFFVSGSPFEDYQKSASMIRGRSDIADAINMESNANVTVCGIVKDLKVFQRNKDGRPFCGFSIYDASGEIEAKCFTNPYEKYGALIDDNAALCISGKTRVDKNILDDGTEVEFGRYISIDSVAVLQPDKTGPLIMSGDTLVDWFSNQDAIQAFEDPNGYELYFSDRSLRELTKCDFKVSESILLANFPGLLISKLNA